jgi:hypothetical protein
MSFAFGVSLLSNSTSTANRMTQNILCPPIEKLVGLVVLVLGFGSWLSIGHWVLFFGHCDLGLGSTPGSLELLLGLLLGLGYWVLRFGVWGPGLVRWGSGSGCCAFGLWGLGLEFATDKGPLSPDATSCEPISAEDEETLARLGLYSPGPFRGP